MPQSNHLYSTSSAIQLPTSISSGYPHAHVPQLGPYEADRPRSESCPDQDVYAPDLPPTQDDYRLEPRSAPLLQYRGPCPPGFVLPPNSNLDGFIDRSSDAFGSYTWGESPYVHGEYHSRDLGSDGPYRYHVEPNPPSHSAINSNVEFPWNRPQNPHATTISGGTFISGNVSNIERHSEASESQ